MFGIPLKLHKCVRQLAYSTISDAKPMFTNVTITIINHYRNCLLCRGADKVGRFFKRKKKKKTPLEKIIDRSFSVSSTHVQYGKGYDVFETTPEQYSLEQWNCFFAQIRILHYDLVIPLHYC
jgi:hypothetical protein